jgi:hypothetical protein
MLIFGDRVDVSDALATDSQPRFPLPQDLLQSFTNPHSFTNLACIISTWMTDFPDLIDITLIMSDIAQMSQHINDMAESALLWGDIWFMTRKFMPIMQRTLALPRDDLARPNLKREFVIREALRLTLIVFLGIVNKRFRISPDGIAIYKNRVTDLLVNSPVAWSPFLDLRLWVLVVVGLVAEGQEKEWHIGEIVTMMRQLDLNTWSEALSTVKGIIWIDALMDEDANNLAEEIKKLTSLS